MNYLDYPKVPEKITYSIAEWYEWVKKLDQVYERLEKLEKLRIYCIEEGFLDREPLGFTRHCDYCNAERLDIRGMEKEPHRENCLYRQALAVLGERE